MLHGLMYIRGCLFLGTGVSGFIYPKRIVIGPASVPNPLIEFSAFAPVLAFPSRFLLDRTTSADSNESQGVNWLFKSHRQVSSRVITVPFIYEITL